MGDKLQRPSTRQRTFKIPVIKHLKQDVGEAADQSKSHNGIRRMFKTMIEVVVIHQDIKALIFDLPAFMPVGMLSFNE